MPTRSAPPPEAVARFRQAIGEVDRLGVAVSGGPDSLALLRLAHAALPGMVAAATVDHGLRPEARAEALFVAEVCAELGVSHDILGPEHLGSGNLQEAARMLRYRLLGNWARDRDIATVATAHQREDVAESFLMRALRGSGIGGLARMAWRCPLPYGDGTVTLIRPLLDWSRAELATIAGDAVMDPSNSDPRYDRARVRALMAREAMLEAEQLARAAANLAEADAALDWMTEQAWRSRACLAGAEISLDPADLPREIVRRLAARAVLQLAPDWSGSGIDRMVDALQEGRAATLAGVKAAERRGSWHFRTAPARRTSR